MIAFKKRKIKNQNCIGDILQEARDKTGLSLRMVGKHIRIDQKYLELMENDKWNELPGEIYAKNFLKKYCEFLDLDYKNLPIEFSQIDCFKYKQHQKDFRKRTRRTDFFNLPKIIKISAIVLIVVLILFYFCWQINSIIKPPEITLFHPVTDLVISDKSIVISGKIEPEVELKINNEQVILDDNYTFNQILNLQSGLNIITIQAKKKYSKTQTIERKIVVE